MSSSNSSCVEVRKRGEMTSLVLLATLIGRKDHLTSIGCNINHGIQETTNQLFIDVTQLLQGHWFDVLSIEFQQEPT